MSVPTIRGASFPVPVLAPGRSDRDKPRQWLIALAVVAAVIVLDQSIKWWAWRHVSGAKIN
jgi:hypothetical protein